MTKPLVGCQGARHKPAGGYSFTFTHVAWGEVIRQGRQQAHCSRETGCENYTEEAVSTIWGELVTNLTKWPQSLSEIELPFCIWKTILLASLKLALGGHYEKANASLAADRRAPYVRGFLLFRCWDRVAGQRDAKWYIKWYILLCHIVNSKYLSNIIDS